jgi:exonuclease VII large subunit
VLDRGYSLVETVEGQLVRDSAQLRPEDVIKLTFASGQADAAVLGVR